MSMIKEYHPVRTLQSYIMPQNSFFTHLENERARADRNNKGFVLIVFDMTSANGTTELFINSVKNRVRKNRRYRLVQGKETWAYSYMRVLPI